MVRPVTNNAWKCCTSKLPDIQPTTVKPSTAFQFDLIGHGANIPTRQFFIEISRNIQSKSYMVSVTECCWDFQNNALWDTWDEVPYKAC